jgi:hypothetical protein
MILSLVHPSSILQYIPPPSALLKEEIVTHPEVICGVDTQNRDVSLHFNLTNISAVWHHLHDHLLAISAAVCSNDFQLLCYAYHQMQMHQIQRQQSQDVHS